MLIYVKGVTNFATTVYFMYVSSLLITPSAMVTPDRTAVIVSANCLPTRQCCFVLLIKHGNK